MYLVTHISICRIQLRMIKVYIYIINKYSENAKSHKALVSMYIHELRRCQKLMLFAFS